MDSVAEDLVMAMGRDTVVDLEVAVVVAMVTLGVADMDFQVSFFK